MSERCPICGLLGHNDERLPAEVLRQALQRHAIYEGATPQLLAALDALRAINEPAYTFITQLDPGEVCEGEILNERFSAAYDLATEAIKEARGA